MPKKVPELTAAQVKALGEGTFNVGGAKGLYIRKRPRQTIFFVRYSDVSGRRHDYVLGNYPQLTLATARKEAIAVLLQLERGEDPIEQRNLKRQQIAVRMAHQEALKAGALNTFEKVSRDWIEDRDRGNYWCHNPKGKFKTTRMLELHAFPFIGSTHINDVTAEMVRDCLSPIWKTHSDTAKKTKSLIHSVFRWAMAKHITERKDNPAAWDGALGVLMEPLQMERKAKEHYAACAVNEIPLLFSETQPYYSISARACEFAILTAARSQAVRFATWDEFDLDKGIWVIPTEHDKVKAPNRDRTIFLSTQAVCLLRDLPRFSETNVVFPNNRGHSLSDLALTMFLRGLHEVRFNRDGIGWIDPDKSKVTGRPCTITLHGTARATFRTWAKDDGLGNNKKFDQDAVEMCLLHDRKDVYRGAYDRAPLERERRKIMQEWGDYCCSLRRKVTSK